jgi:hypothetical protein
MSRHAGLVAHSVLVSGSAWGTPEGDDLQSVRDDMLDALAEDETGVSRNEAMLTRLYSASQLSDEQWQRASKWRICRSRLVRELPKDPARFMRYCWAIAEGRKSHAEAVALVADMTTLAAD